MYTVKILFTHHKTTDPKVPLELFEESTAFIPAHRVNVLAKFNGEDWEEKMAEWKLDSYSNLLSVIDYADEHTGSRQWSNGVLIHVEFDGNSAYYLGSKVWLLGPTGATIEKLS